jgi:hypothetical protein
MGQSLPQAVAMVRFESGKSNEFTDDARLCEQSILQSEWMLLLADLCRAYMPLKSSLLFVGGSDCWVNRSCFSAAKSGGCRRRAPMVATATHVTSLLSAALAVLPD